MDNRYIKYINQIRVLKKVVLLPSAILQILIKMFCWNCA